MLASTDSLMQARWIDEWGGSLLNGQRPRPVVGRDDVLVAVEACGVGLTVLNCIRGDLARSVAITPRIPGHEYVGRIVEVGDGVDIARLGERVMAYFYLFCGACNQCLAGQESLCEQLAGFLGVDIDGGYAPLAALPARNALPLPESIDAVEATAIPDAIATPVHVATVSNISIGDRVVVVGAGGGVGVHMVQVAKLGGADVVGLEPNPAKRAFLEDALGVVVEDVDNFTTPVRRAGWERGADVVVDLVGSTASVRWALNAVAENGRVVLLTTFEGVNVPFTPRELVFRQVSIIGSRYARRSELLRAAELVASGLIQPVVSHSTASAHVEVLHQQLTEGTLLGRGALTWNVDTDPCRSGAKNGSRQ